MSDISRRVFLARASAGVAAAGLMAVVPSLAGQAGASEQRTKRGAGAVSSPATSTSHEAAGADGPLVVHIPDARNGEIHFMYGTREVVHTDRALVARLLHDAR